MTKVLIIEDELPAADRLMKLLENLGHTEVLDRLDSVESAVEWFEDNPSPDLAFFDIQLADGKSFSIFEKCQVNCPVIFTTAYDEYALKAFKVNSIDYLLKPIDETELKSAWDKFLRLNQSSETNYELIAQRIKETLSHSTFKSRFLIKSGDQFKFIQTDHISYFFSDAGMTFLVNETGEQFLIDEKLEALELILNPEHFHRISRKFIVRDMAISKISSYFNGRLILELNPGHAEEVIVSRERVSKFKSWLNK